MGWTRRQVLFAGGAATIALAAASAGVALQPTVHVAPRAPLQALDPRSFSILVAVCDTLCPGVHGAPPAAELGVAEGIDGFLASCHPGVVAEVIQALLLVENALPALLLDHTLRRPFTACEPSSRLAALEAFRDSPIALRRTVYKALLGLATATYWGDPRTFAVSGYTPPDFTAPG